MTFYEVDLARVAQRQADRLAEAERERRRPRPLRSLAAAGLRRAADRLDPVAAPRIRAAA